MHRQPMSVSKILAVDSGAKGGRAHGGIPGSYRDSRAHGMTAIGLP